MTYEISNESLRVTIKSLGAEMTEITDVNSDRNYLWKAEEGICPVQAPNLFPIASAMLNDQYTYRGQTYTMPKHGFAKATEFEVVDQTQTSIVFRIEDSKETYKMYPFKFKLDIAYILEGKEVFVKYCVKNLDQDELYFSIGGHPGFFCPMSENETIEDYAIYFEKEEDGLYYYDNEAGTFGENKLTIQEEKSDMWQLKNEIPIKGAIVLADLESQSLVLKNKTETEFLKFTWDNFKNMAFYMKVLDETYKAHRFICIEPWNGIGDLRDHDGQLEKKKDIIRLEGHSEFRCGYSVAIA